MGCFACQTFWTAVAIYAITRGIADPAGCFVSAAAYSGAAVLLSALHGWSASARASDKRWIDHAGVNGDGYVFTGDQGKPLRSDAISRGYRDLVQGAKVEGWTMKHLRNVGSSLGRLRKRPEDERQVFLGLVANGTNFFCEAPDLGANCLLELVNLIRAEFRRGAGRTMIAVENSQIGVWPAAPARKSTNGRLAVLARWGSVSTETEPRMLIEMRFVTTNETRKRMRCVGRENTRPEMIVRQALHRMGFRYRLHRRDLPGSPDLTLPRYKSVVFVHGCFWHGHSCRSRSLPQRNREYWLEKIRRNQTRDRTTARKLQALGWRILIIWECQLTDARRREKLLSALAKRLTTTEGNV